MASEYVPLFAFGILLLWIGYKLQNRGENSVIVLGLIATGLILILYNGYVGWNELTSGL